VEPLGDLVPQVVAALVRSKFFDGATGGNRGQPGQLLSHKNSLVNESSLKSMIYGDLNDFSP